MNKKVIASAALGAVVLTGSALGIGSTMVMAPGTKAYGVEVGMDSPSASYNKITEAVGQHEVVVDDTKFTLSELGYKVNQSTTDFNSYRAINGKWNSTIPITVSAPDTKQTNAVLKTKMKNLTTPVNAGVVYKDGKWSMVPGSVGYTVEMDLLTDQINTDIASGVKTTTVKSAMVHPEISDGTASKVASDIDKATGEAAMVMGDQSDPIDKAVASSFFAVKPEGNSFKIEVNGDKISAFAATVPAKYNTEVVNGSVVVDENGKVLKTLKKSVNGIKVAPPAELAKVMERSVEQLKFTFPVLGEVVEAKVETKFRRAEVDLTTKWAKFYENDELVYDFPVAVGTKDNPTDVGEFRVHTQLETQDMGCNSARFDYCIKGVPWISYYNADEGFHSAWWAKSYGTPDSEYSHGCVNMRTPDAKAVFEFLEVGSPVKVTR